MAAHRSRAEFIALWTQLLLVLSVAITLAQSAVNASASIRASWVFFLPLICVLPSVAAFRDIRAGSWGVLSGAALCFVALLWTERSGPASLPDWIVEALGLTWPLFAAAGVLLVAFRIRMHREQEASLLHRHAHGNRAELEASEACGCLACERIYFPSEVQHWLSKSTGETAVCPYCGTDAVVGSASGIPITPGVLARAHARWFLDGADEIVQ
jgi:hypothetical protein